MAHVEMPNQVIRVIPDGDRTIVHVDGFAAVSGSLRIDSSNLWTPDAVPSFSPGELRELANRLANGGQAKGRVLYARHVAFPANTSTVVAAMCLHMDTGLTRITYLAIDHELYDLQRQYAVRQLIECLKTIAGQHNCRQLEWAHHSDHAAKACCKEHGFRRVARSKARYKGLRRNDFLVEIRL